MSCVSSSTFVVLLNGETTSFFRSGRGLRQGCPLSPLLFILVMEGLSLLLKKIQREGKLMGVKVSRVVKILHLLFVDDVLIMTRASQKEWQEIDILIKLFCKASGLQVNVTKSTVLYVGLIEEEINVFKELLPYNSVDLSVGFKYLGYFLKTGLYKVEDWRWLLAKMEKK
jgi:cytochrome b subunit of formate dehydrogenase